MRPPLRGKDDLGVEKRAGYAGGYGYQLGLAVKDLDLGGAGHFREIYGPAAADQGGDFFGGGDARQSGHQLPRMDEQRPDNSLLHCGFQGCHRVCVRNGELGYGGAAQAGQMSAAAQFSSHLVGDRPNIGAGGDAGAEGGLIIFWVKTRLIVRLNPRGQQPAVSL